MQEVAPTSADHGLAGLEDPPGAASALSGAGSAPPPPTPFMLTRTLNKKAKELKLAMEVSRVGGAGAWMFSSVVWGLVLKVEGPRRVGVWY